MINDRNLLEEQYFFVDEAGDSVFYNKHGKYIVGEEGCSKILLLGFVRTTDPTALRKEIVQLNEEIVNDPFYKGIPSLNRTKIAFHAKDDIPEIRERFFKRIVSLEYKAEFVVARKSEQLFNKKYHRNESLFYSDLIVKLFENKLHLAKRNIIYFSKRGNKSRQKPLEEAIQKAISMFERKWNVKIISEHKVFAQTPSNEPCLQIADYMNWAIQRAYIKREDRYFNFVESKVSFLCDIFDFDKYPKNFYSQRNKFKLDKISPL